MIAGVLLAAGGARRFGSQELLASVGDERRSIVVPLYDGVRGNPVLFAKEVFAELRAVEGDVGARGVIERDRARVTYLEWEGGAPRDVDTPEDLEDVRG